VALAAPPIADVLPTTRTPKTWYRTQQMTTVVFVVGPLLALLYGVVRLWGHGISIRDVVLTVGLYLVVGHGVSVGFHRLFAHRSFRATRPLKVALAVAGSMAFEGSIVAWVANHRLHHAHSDKPGDPHSPALSGTGVRGMLAGLWHAHVGWFFRPGATCQRQFAPDLLQDRDIVIVSRLFPLWCAVSLALPFAIGWVWGGGVGAAATALLWAGAVRICVLHHITWSINSVCHTFGRRPFRTGDHSANVAALAVISMGESWHNAHHAFPAMARHGVERHQLDSSARVIKVLEWMRLADSARWPTATRLAARRI
jgi:stearoyl-CoA desaturase (delta-9 desaturase)